MRIIDIVGSPRKNGLTNNLVSKALEGSASVGAEVEKVHLIDYKVKPYTPTSESAPDKLSRLCESADGIILGAPIYWGDINGLTKDFMDTVRIKNANGKYGLGITIAGGTGKGLISGIQSIYHFFYHREIKGMDPTPVSRFNFEEALGSLYNSGIKLVRLCRDEPFKFQNLVDRIEYYETLPYMNLDFLDEILMLVEQLIRISNGKAIEQAKAEYDRALGLLEKGERLVAVKHAVKAYDLLYF